MPAAASSRFSVATTVVDVALAVEPALVEHARRSPCTSSGSSARSDRSSSSHFSCQTPSRLASGAKRSSTSRAVRSRRPGPRRRGHQEAQRLRALGELDQHDADVLDHREQHLAQALRLRRALVGAARRRQRADFVHPRDAGDQRARRRRRSVRRRRRRRRRPAAGSPISSAARTVAASSFSPARIVAVPIARSSSGSPSRPIGRRRSARAHSRARPRRRRGRRRDRSPRSPASQAAIASRRARPGAAWSTATMRALCAAATRAGARGTAGPLLARDRSGGGLGDGVGQRLARACRRPRARAPRPSPAAPARCRKAAAARGRRRPAPRPLSACAARIARSPSSRSPSAPAR